MAGAFAVNAHFCHSCTAPLSLPQFQGKAAHLCRHCTDEAGNLLPREVVEQGVAHWLRTWQPGVDEAQSLRRARLFMSALPAWAAD